MPMLMTDTFNWPSAIAQAIESYGLSSNNIEDALSLTIQVFNIVSADITFELQRETGTTVIQIRIHNGNPPPLAKTLVFASAQRLLQILVAPDFLFHSIDMDFEADEKFLAACQQFFRCPLATGSGCSGLRFLTKTIQSTLPGSNDELAHLNEKLFYKRLNDSLGNHTGLQAKVVLLKNLHRGDTDATFVAAELGIPVRTLQYQLSKEKTSFRKLLDATRHEQAVAFIRQDKSITETAHLLGYTDASNFCRAFRGWTGLSPGEYGSRI